MFVLVAYQIAGEYPQKKSNNLAKRNYPTVLKKSLRFFFPGTKGEKGFKGTKGEKGFKGKRFQRWSVRASHRVGFSLLIEELENVSKRTN